MLESDETILRDLAHQCKDATEKARYLALHAISIGYSVQHVADIFCVSESIVYKWINRWMEEKKMTDKPRLGRPPIFDEKDRVKLRKLVDENNPKKYGFNMSAWDCRALKKYFAMHGTLVSIETLRRTLKEMGASYVKAVLQYPEADEQKRTQFARELLKQEKKGNIVIFFEDEMSTETNPRSGYGWTFEKRLVIVAPQRGRKRLNFFGATSPYTGESIEFASANAKAPSFVNLLRKIWKKHPRKKVRVYIDGAPTHKAKEVTRFLEHHPNIEIQFMPAYSPDLNPREYWHKHVRQNLLNNTPFKNAHSLATSLHAFTKNTPKTVIKTVCTLKPIYNLLS